jgi:hypothetical protein
MTTTNKPLCWVPYYTAELTHVTTKPCCKFNFSDNLPYPDLRDFNSEKANKWRTDSFMGDELLNQCRACKVPDSIYSYERQNRITFQRDGWTEPTKPELRKLIIGMDNICASSCIQCGPHFSTTIGKLADAQPKHIVERIKLEQHGTQQIDLAQLDGQIGALEVLHLFGGEPLFSPALIPLIKMCQAQSPRLRRISLSTGLTRIKESHVALLDQLGIEIHVNVSLDGPMELNSWIRGITPEEFKSSWNMLLRYPNITITGFQTTIASYNVFALPEYIDFVYELWTSTSGRFVRRAKEPYIMSTIILSPEVLSPKQLPPEYKQRCQDKLKQTQLTSPKCTQEFLKTALYSLDQESTCDWNASLNRLNAYPSWRGNSDTWHTMWSRYME